jgi:hypothetical protein
MVLTVKSIGSVPSLGMHCAAVEARAITRVSNRLSWAAAVKGQIHGHVEVQSGQLHLQSGSGEGEREDHEKMRMVHGWLISDGIGRNQATAGSRCTDQYQG